MSLKDQTVNGVIWSGLEKFISMFIQLICTLIIARLLTPADFGLVGMLAIFMALAQTILDSGFGQALIRKPDANNIDYSTVFYFNLFVSIILYIILYFSSHSISIFFNTPLLEKISKISFIVIPINGFSLIQYTILNKDINFKSLSKTSIISAFISGIVGIIYAYYNRSVWALVAQNITFYFVRSILLWVLSSWRPSLQFSYKSIRSLFSFSVNLLITGIIGTLFSNIYSLVIGKMYSPAELGYYSQADKFQKLPSTSITEVVQRVTFPVLSKIQNDDKRIREAYKKVISITEFVVVPIMLFLAVISNNLFEVVLTQKWNQAAVYFQILCIVGALYPLHSININILNVKGNSRKILFLEILRKSILVVVLILSANFPILYLVFGQVVYSVLVLFLNLYFCGKEIQLPVMEQIRDLIPTFLLSSFVMALVRLEEFLLSNTNVYILLTLQTITAVVLYLLIAKALHFQAIQLISSIVKDKIPRFSLLFKKPL